MGMAIGNHSWSHPYDPAFATLGSSRLDQELGDTQALLERLGVRNDLFRPPRWQLGRGLAESRARHGVGGLHPFERGRELRAEPTVVGGYRRVAAVACEPQLRLCVLGLRVRVSRSQLRLLETLLELADLGMERRDAAVVRGDRGRRVLGRKGIGSLGGQPCGLLRPASASFDSVTLASSSRRGGSPPAAPPRGPRSLPSRRCSRHPGRTDPHGRPRALHVLRATAPRSHGSARPSARPPAASRRAAPRWCAAPRLGSSSRPPGAPPGRSPSIRRPPSDRGPLGARSCVRRARTPAWRPARRPRCGDARSPLRAPRSASGGNRLCWFAFSPASRRSTSCRSSESSRWRCATVASRSARRSSASAILACPWLRLYSLACACASATLVSASRKRAFASSLRASSSFRAASSNATMSRSS